MTSAPHTHGAHRTKRTRSKKSLQTAVAVLLSLGATFAWSCAPQEKPRVRRLVVRPQPPAPPVYPLYIAWGDHTVETRLAEIGQRSRSRWEPYFRRAGLSYPPRSVVLVTFKRERRVEVYGGPSPYDLAMVRTLPVSAASGGPGPKLREGDRQVPEGIYEIASLNPNSAYHVALRLAYPNGFDRMMAARDKRRRLGGDIMIHGSDRSIGCVAVGDQAAEDLFVIAADAGLENVSVVIAPRDFRRTGENEVMPGQPRWVRDLYDDLHRKLRSLPEPPPVVAADEGAASGGGLAAR